MGRPTPTTVVHFTRVEHLPTIVTSGLLADSSAQSQGVLNIEVGNTGIKARRAERRVPVAPGGFVADYVPFYFAPRSPMMYSIHMGNVPTYSDGCDRLVYLVSTVERLQELGVTILLTDRNAVFTYADIVRFDGRWPPDDFIDWPLMKATYWNDTLDDPRRMERRMAECLVHSVVPWEAFDRVVAKSNAVASEARTALSAAGSSITVSVGREWYF
jgi:hypothetical protein